MKFSEYIKLCRTKSFLTQEQLVQQLYQFNEDFIGVDTRTLIRWESGQTQPSINRKITIIKLFQVLTKEALPHFNNFTTDEIQAQICTAGIDNIIGKNKELVLNFPSSFIQVDNMKVTHLKYTDTIDNIIKIATGLDKEFTQNYSQLTNDNFKEWALHPSSLFLICEISEQFFGLLFTLRLKPDIFERIIKFDMQEKDLNISHFATFEEVGCNYLFNFFAQSNKAASLLYLRYYAHLIANQKIISKIGATAMMNEAKSLLERINLNHSKDITIDGYKISSYEASINDVLLNASVIKMIFNNQKCPESNT